MYLHILIAHDLCDNPVLFPWFIFHDWILFLNKNQPLCKLSTELNYRARLSFIPSVTLTKVRCFFVITMSQWFCKGINSIKLDRQFLGKGINIRMFSNLSESEHWQLIKQLTQTPHSLSSCCSWSTDRVAHQLPLIA